MVVEAPRVAPASQAGALRHRPRHGRRRTHSADHRRLRPGGRHHHAGRPGRRAPPPNALRHRRPATPDPTWSARWASRPRSRTSATSVLVGGGVGTAVIYPQAGALKARRQPASPPSSAAAAKPYVILEEELGRVCDAVYPCTDDGSYGYHGFVTGKLQAADRRRRPIRSTRCITAGPVPMMRAVAEVTRAAGHPHHRLAQPDHGRRHRHVRRLPRARSAGKMHVRLRRWPRVRRPPGRFRELADRLDGLPRAGEAAWDAPAQSTSTAPSAEPQTAAWLTSRLA